MVFWLVQRTPIWNLYYRLSQMRRFLKFGIVGFRNRATSSNSTLLVFAIEQIPQFLHCQILNQESFEERKNRISYTKQAFLDFQHCSQTMLNIVKGLFCVKYRFQKQCCFSESLYIAKNKQCRFSRILRIVNFEQCGFSEIFSSVNSRNVVSWKFPFLSTAVM